MVYTDRYIVNSKGNLNMIEMSIEKIKEEASKYAYSEAFRRGNKEAYKAAKRLKILHELYPKPYYNQQGYSILELKNAALKYKTQSEWLFSTDGPLYYAAQRRGLLAEVAPHMSSAKEDHIKWTKPKIKNSAAKYSTVTEWRDASPGAYAAAKSRNIINEVTAHMLKGKVKVKNITTGEIFESVRAAARNYGVGVSSLQGKILRQRPIRRKNLDYYFMYLDDGGALSTTPPSSIRSELKKEEVSFAQEIPVKDPNNAILIEEVEKYVTEHKILPPDNITLGKVVHYLDVREPHLMGLIRKNIESYKANINLLTKGIATAAPSVQKQEPVLSILAQSPGFVVNKSLAKSVGFNAAVLLSVLIDRRNSFQNKGELGIDGSFFNTELSLKEETGLGKFALLAAKRILVARGLINVVKRGLPAKNYYIIHDIKIERLLS